MKNLFSLKCFEIGEAVQEGINEFSNLSGYKRIELQKRVSRKPQKKHFALITSLFIFFKLIK